MGDLLPKLEISFDKSDLQADPSNFVIEELTTSVYISTRKRRKRNFVDVWMEFVIRRDGGHGDSEKVPDILLRFNEDFSSLNEPTCRLPEIPRSQGTQSDDMNFVMHSDIWFSFIQQEGQNIEFMTKGYNQPLRILYPCCYCENKQGADVAEESWIKAGSHILSSASPWKKKAEQMFAGIKMFNDDVIHSKTPNALWEDLNVHLGYESRRVSRLKDNTLYAPVYFEKGCPTRARFALRRLPWKILGEEFRNRLYGISYGGTALIFTDRSTYRLTPVLFALESSRIVEASLGDNEALRFWVRWQSQNALDFDIIKDRFSYAYTLYIHPKVERFNSFFRVPEGFDFVPGSVTELKHYPVPPRLFFIWEGHKVKPDQCFSDHKLFEGKENIEIELYAEFSDKNRETNRLVNLFILAAMINILNSLAMQGWFNNYDHNTLAGKLHLAGSSSLGIAITVFAAAWEYKRRAFSLGGLILLILTGFFLIYIFETGLVLFMFCIAFYIALFVWTFGIQQELMTRLSSLAFSLRRVQRYREKRKYLGNLR